MPYQMAQFASKCAGSFVSNHSLRYFILKSSVESIKLGIVERFVENLSRKINFRTIFYSRKLTKNSTVLFHLNHV